MLIIVLSAFLLGAVIYDLVNHRLPNYFLMFGLLTALVVQGLTVGVSGLLAGLLGGVAGFAIFIPMYIGGGMAAGDVKLMTVVGFFVGMPGALWAGVYSLLVGGVLGILYLLYKGELHSFFGRYWVILSLRRYMSAGEHSAARHRFPYALAIAVGSLLSMYWTPF